MEEARRGKGGESSRVGCTSTEMREFRPPPKRGSLYAHFLSFSLLKSSVCCTLKIGMWECILLQILNEEEATAVMLGSINCILLLNKK